MDKKIIDILENRAMGGYKDLEPLQAQTVLDFIYKYSSMTNLYEEVWKDAVRCRLEDRPNDKLTEQQITQIAMKLIYKCDPMWEDINDTIDMYINKEVK